ncbi:MAG: patatin-like phospholipase family protein [Chloroflexi bacterium]|nr:patatin-like phospholipase family protein [Chloroflexota bacterium]
MRRELPLLKKKPGAALVLSGGATKAFYFHIGVLKVLDLENVTSIVGTSAGAVAGTLVASGVEADALVASLYQKAVYVPRIDTVVKRLTATMVFQPAFGHMASQGAHTFLAALRLMLSLPMVHRGDVVSEILDRLILSQRHAPSFFNAAELENLMRELLPSNDFRDTLIDLYVTATSLDEHKRAVFNAHVDYDDGVNAFMTDVPIHRAVLASSAVPGMFEPVKIKDRYYIDGEVRQTLSMDIGLALADTIICSHTYHPLYSSSDRSVRDEGWYNIVKQSVHIALYERILGWREVYEQQFPDKRMIWIEPDPDDREFFLAPEFSFRPDLQRRLVEIGERAARRALENALT